MPYRRKGEIHSDEPRYTTEALLTSQNNEPDFMYQNLMSGSQLTAAIQALPFEARELILLAKVKELSPTELASIFGCSTGAVRVRLHRAIALLKEYLTDASTEYGAERNEAEL